MQNFFAIETEAAHQRHEWARAVEADARAAQARPQPARRRWSLLPRLIRARLRSRDTAWRPLTVWRAPIQGQRVPEPS